MVNKAHNIFYMVFVVGSEEDLKTKQKHMCG